MSSLYHLRCITRTSEKRVEGLEGQAFVDHYLLLAEVVRGQGVISVYFKQLGKIVSGQKPLHIFRWI